MKIDEKTVILDVIRISKKTIDIFEKYKLDCTTCKGSSQCNMDKLSINNHVDLDSFIKDIQKAIEKE